MISDDCAHNLRGRPCSARLTSKLVDAHLYPSKFAASESRVKHLGITNTAIPGPEENLGSACSIPSMTPCVSHPKRLPTNI